MSNFVSNRIICKKDFLKKYLYDENPAGVLQQSISPIAKLSFNHLFSMSTIDEYKAVHGTTIAYDYGVGCMEMDPDFVDIRFQTEKCYPIRAILKAIELDHSIIWMCVEDNYQYISIFQWSSDIDDVKEYIVDLLNSDKYAAHIEEIGSMTIHSWDEGLWHYGLYEFGGPDEIMTGDLETRHFECYPLQWERI